MTTANKSAGESTRGYHRLVTLGECERRYGLRYGMRLEPRRTADALALGSLVHLACMHHYAGLASDQDVLDPVEAMRQAPARIAHQFHTALDVWPRYVEWAATEDAAWEFLAVEQEWRARIGGKLITARVDAVARERTTGAVWAWNHKTGAGDLAMNIRSQGAQGQIALEELFCERVIAPHYDALPGGVLINAISTSGGEPVAQRGRARVQPAWRASVLTALTVLAARAEAVEAAPDWGSEHAAFALPVNPEACQGRWAQSRCSYFDLCREGPRALDTRGGFDSVIDNVTLLREASGA